MRQFFATIVLLTLAAASVFAEAPPATPDTRGRASDPTAIAAPKPTVAQFLKKLPGDWSGEQVMRSPKGQFMTMKVTETYREKKRDDITGISGELVCVIGSGDKTKTIRSTSFTWGDADGKGHSEVTQDGKTEKYITFVSSDTLVFIPDVPLNKEGKRDKPDNGSGVRRVEENGESSLMKKGFLTAPDGVYLIQGKLKKVK